MSQSVKCVKTAILGAIIAVCIVLVGVAFTSQEAYAAEAVTHKVTFVDDNDGVIPVPEAQIVKDGDKAVAPKNTPIKDSYEFQYWATKTTTTYAVTLVYTNYAEYDFNTPVTSDITLYAVYSTKFENSANLTSVYRLYNPNNGAHHYTTDSNEYKDLLTYGWIGEGLSAKMMKESETPVYRLYNPFSGDHHFTKDENEYKTLQTYGWKAEGVAWYSCDNKEIGIPVYRLYNSNLTVGTHHYTTDKDEYDELVKLGWKNEDICWYAYGSQL